MHDPAEMMTQPELSSQHPARGCMQTAGHRRPKAPECLVEKHISSSKKVVLADFRNVKLNHKSTSPELSATALPQLRRHASQIRGQEARCCNEYGGFWLVEAFVLSDPGSVMC